MISRTLRHFITTTPKVKYSFSAHHQPPPSKLPKVKDTVVNLYIKNRYGVVQKVPAKIGESLLETIVRMKVHAFGPLQTLCNGYDYTYRPHYRPHDNDTQGPRCGDCRVVFQDNWFQRVHQETEGYNPNQQRILKTEVLDLKSGSRLACCIPIESWMQGMTLSVDITPSESQEPLII